MWESPLRSLSSELESMRSSLLTPMSQARVPSIVLRFSVALTIFRYAFALLSKGPDNS